MTFIQALLLGLLQGITEFLPVSSSGHLVLAQILLEFNNPPISFDILLHMATLIAIIYYFRDILIDLLNKSFQAVKSLELNKVPKIIWFLILGTFPAIFVGIFFKDLIELLFSNVLATGISFIITGILLLINNLKHFHNKTLDKMSWLDSIIIGIFQAIAIVPAISRSGSTITGGLLRGFKKEEAFIFSFLLAIPAILGAQIQDLPQLFKTPTNQIPQYLLGFFIAGISGFIALNIFKKVVVQNKLHWFAYYCIILGIITLILTI